MVEMKEVSDLHGKEKILKIKQRPSELSKFHGTSGFNGKGIFPGNTGVIAGGAITGVVIILLVAAVAIFLWRHKQSQSEPSSSIKSEWISVWRRGQNQPNSNSTTDKSFSHDTQLALPAIPSPGQSDRPDSTPMSAEYGQYSVIDDSQVHMVYGPYSTINEMGFEEDSQLFVPVTQTQNSPQPGLDHLGLGNASFSNVHKSATPQPAVQMLSNEQGSASNPNAPEVQTSNGTQGNGYLSLEQYTYSNAHLCSSNSPEHMDQAPSATRHESALSENPQPANTHYRNLAQSDNDVSSEQNPHANTRNLCPNSSENMDQMPSGRAHESNVPEGRQSSDPSYQSLEHSSNVYLHPLHTDSAATPTVQ